MPQTLVDWAALLKVEPDLPQRLNRAFFSLERLVGDLQAFQAGVEEDGASPTGPAGGQVGGSFPDQLDVRGLRETSGPTLLTLGAWPDGQFLKRVGSTAVGAAAGGSSIAGSIFSPTGPVGAPAPVAVYDFTRYDPSLSVAANLANAALVGPALTAAGGAQIHYLARSNNSGQSPYALTPMGSRVDGGALHTGQGTDYVHTTGSPAAVLRTGAMTVEWLGHFTEQPSAADVSIFICNAAGELQAANNLYELRWTFGATTWRYTHEAGAGVDSTADFFTSPLAQLTDGLHSPVLLALTRSSAGSLRLYVNGRHTFDAVTAAPSALPDGGTTCDLYIGAGSDAAHKLATLAFRMFDDELTAGEVSESWQRTMFGASP